MSTKGKPAHGYRSIGHKLTRSKVIEPTNFASPCPVSIRGPLSAPIASLRT